MSNSSVIRRSGRYPWGSTADEIQQLKKYNDEELEIFWSNFEDVPMNPQTERMEAVFLDFPIGTQREEIWKWFDVRHSKGIAFLLDKR